MRGLRPRNDVVALLRGNVMNSEIKPDNAEMEYLTAPLNLSRIALGTWAIGGWMWGGTDEAAAIGVIHEAVDRGVTELDPIRGTTRG